jgi:truncated hemoglobin YjbI
LQRDDFPLFPEIAYLAWKPQESTATLTYFLTNYVERLNKWAKQPLGPQHLNFGITAYNARDLAGPFHSQCMCGGKK